jgi:polyphosphate kinase
VAFTASAGREVDEFFVARVASLRRGSGPVPLDALVAIREQLNDLHAMQEALWLDELRPALAAERIRIGPVEECNRTELQALRRRFEHEIHPLLTPIAVGPGAPFPHVPSLVLSVGALVRDTSSGAARFVRVNVPAGLPRFLEVGTKGRRVPVGETIVHFLPDVLGAAEIESAEVFRLTRDVELSAAFDTDDVVEALKLQLRRRRLGDIVRLEIGPHASPELLDALRHHLLVEDDQVFVTAAPLGPAMLRELADQGPARLRRPPLRPRRAPFPKSSPRELFERVRRRDVLLHHPWDAPAAADALVAAAEDAKVAHVKTTVRPSDEPSKATRALARAARAGTDVVCVVPLRARLDAERTTEWASILERSGAVLVSGDPELELHARLALVVRRERGRLRGYVQLGTGEPSAFHEDLTLFTADEAVAADVADLFNAVSGLAEPAYFRKLLVGPWYLRAGLLREIGRVTEAAATGTAARIRMKVNALADPELVDALYAAAVAGASVEIVTLGICTLRPGVPGLSEAISVRSVLGRFVAHSRIFLFEAGDDVHAYIGSADPVPAALDGRIEVLAPVEDARRRATLTAVLDALAADRGLAWTLGRDGSWQRV